MRILFLETDPLWIHGLPNGFRDAGHEILFPENFAESTIQALFTQRKPDVAIAISWTYANLTKQQQEIIRFASQATKVPLVYWDTEGPIQFESDILPLVLTLQPDFVFSIYAERVEDYRKLGFRAAHLEFGYHPSVHFPQPKDPNFISPVAVVANSYHKLLSQNLDFYRLYFLKILLCPIIKMNVPISIYGAGWENMDELLGVTIPKEWIKGSLSYELANKVYSSAEIILGPQNEAGRVSQSTYEILASGGFLLTIDSPGTRQVGVSGRDFVTANSHEQTAELVHFYLNNSEKKRQVQKNGQMAVAHHSYISRALYMIETLKNAQLLG